jgi:ADP-ribose pyrophosphatase YjhB (NUDIX family)
MINKYFKSLSKKRMGVGAFIFNERNELLIVKPSYKDYWSIPGGVVEENESPAQACIREVEEEISIELKEIKFLCVDYTKADENKDKDESLQFIFSGGKITKEEIKSTKIDGKEIIDYRFVFPEQAIELLGGVNRSLVKRLPKCLEALKENKGIYLEDGK